MGRAVIHQREQQRLGEDVDLQGFAALGKGGMDGHVAHPAAGADGEVIAALGVALGLAGAYGGDVGAAFQMLLKDVGDGQVDRQVAPGQDHIILADVLKVGHHGSKTCLRERSQSLPEPTWSSRD